MLKTCPYLEQQDFERLKLIVFHSLQVLVGNRTYTYALPLEELSG